MKECCFYINFSFFSHLSRLGSLIVKRLIPTPSKIAVTDHLTTQSNDVDTALTTRASAQRREPRYPFSSLPGRSTSPARNSSRPDSDAPRSASFSCSPAVSPAAGGAQTPVVADVLNELESSQPANSAALDQAPNANHPEAPRAAMNYGRRIGRGSLRFVKASAKAYLSFVGIGAAIKLVKHPGDLRPDVLQFVLAALTGTERADMLEVQNGRQLVLQTYGNFIDTETQCVDPVVTFVPALRKDNNGPQISGRYDAYGSSGHIAVPVNKTTVGTGTGFLDGVAGQLNATEGHSGYATNGSYCPDVRLQRAGTLSFTTYNLYLPQVAVHEYLHCFTHQNFSDAVNDPKVGSKLSHALVEGTTQYLALQTPFDRRGDLTGKSSASYPDLVRFIGHVADDVGINTLTKAYLSGDQKAIEEVLDVAARHAGSRSK
jgi:hypothetical protein